MGSKGILSDTNESRRKLEATLESFGVKATVLDVVRGPAVTRYEVQPATGVKVSRIVGLTDDIALALAAKDIRMEAPIPGKSAIGIEVPNMEVSVVTMREVMETPAFQNSTSKLVHCIRTRYFRSNYCRQLGKNAPSTRCWRYRIW